MAAPGNDQYHVRMDGSDTGCTGLANAPDPGSGSGQACAFRTPQKAVNSLTPGDDVMLHQGTYARFTIPASFQATASNRTVIEGDPTVSRELITIQSGGAQNAIYSAGGPTSSSRTRFLTFQHFNPEGGTRFSMQFDQEHEDLILRDLYFDNFPSICCRQSSPRASALRIQIGDRVLIEDIEFVGDLNVSQYNLSGTDAMTMFVDGDNNIVRRVVSRNFLGTFYQENGNSNIIEDNIVTDSVCDGDDGCIQIYNDTNTIVRRNLFLDVVPIDGFAVVKMRGGVNPPSSQVYNNTFIGKPGAPTGLRKNAFWIHSAGGGGGPTVVFNNIFMGFGSDGHADGAAVLLSACPTSIQVDYNLYWQNAANSDFANLAGCSGSFNGNSVTADPQLDPTTHAPVTGSPACGAGTTAFVAWDGDRSDPHIGAFPCTGAAGEPVPSAGSDVSSNTSANIVLNGTATDSDGNMTGLSWSVSPSGCSVSQGLLSNNGTTASRSLTLSGCADNIYTATLTATDPTQSLTDTAIVTKDASPPSVPAAPSASLAGASINLTWTASADSVTGVKDYQVWRSANGGAYQSLGRVVSTSYADAATAALTTYTYRISARDNLDNESAQGPASAGLTTPNTGTVILQNGSGSYSGTDDNEMSGPDDPAKTPGPSDVRWNQGGQDSFNVGNGSSTPGAKPDRSLIRFNNLAAAVPPGTTVSSAQLTLNCIDSTGGGNATVQAFRAFKPWVEGNGINWSTSYDIASSWLGWDATHEWGAQGAGNASDSGTDNTGNGTGFDRAATPVGSATVGSCANTAVNIDVTAAVTSWIAGTWQNNGLVLVSANENQAVTSKRFSSSEYATQSLRPKLTITYVQSGPADTTPPTVSMTAPSQGATVNGTVSVSATATDDTGVIGVQFKLDGNNLGSEDFTAPYSISWNSTAVSNGAHTLTAVARDGAGNSTPSAPVSITVSNPDTTPPSVSITSPAGGANVLGLVTITATASDNESVAGVRFLVDGVDVGPEDTSAPYSASWDTTGLPNGIHLLTAIARDAAGNSTTSATVSVTVLNPDTTPPTAPRNVRITN